MEDSSQFYHVPDVPASWNFELLGHAEKTLGDSPIFEVLGIDSSMSKHQYPNWVLPIGKLEGKLAGIYCLGGMVKANYIAEDSPHYVMYDQSLKEKISGFDYRHHHLFAFSRDDVTYHDETGKVDLIKKVLIDERFQDTNVYMRLDIAFQSKQAELILSEMKKCARHIGDCNFLRAWYQMEIDAIRRPEEQLGIGMPEFAQSLEQPGMLESLLVDN